MPSFSNYSRREHGDADVQVRLTVLDDHQGQHVTTGFIDARRQRDGVWEALVDYSYTGTDGYLSHRSDWFPMDQLEVLTIDDVPQNGYVVPPREGR